MILCTRNQHFHWLKVLVRLVHPPSLRGSKAQKLIKKTKRSFKKEKMSQRAQDILQRCTHGPCHEKKSSTDPPTRYMGMSPVERVTGGVLFTDHYFTSASFSCSDSFFHHKLLATDTSIPQVRALSRLAPLQCSSPLLVFMGIVVFSAGKEVRQERGKIDDDDEGVMRAAHFLWAILSCVAFCPVWWVSMEAPSIDPLFLHVSSCRWLLFLGFSSQ